MKGAGVDEVRSGRGQRVLPSLALPAGWVSVQVASLSGIPNE
jgi:hypothetical protein